MLLALALLQPAHAGCPAGSADVTLTSRALVAAYAALDPATVQRAYDDLHAEIACLDEVVSPQSAAEIHLAFALYAKAFTDDHALLRRHLMGLLAADPGLSLTNEIAQGGGTIQREYEDLRDHPPAEILRPLPVGVQWYIDGQGWAADAPMHRAALLQGVEPETGALKSWYLSSGELPASLAASAPLVADAPDAPDDPDATPDDPWIDPDALTDDPGDLGTDPGGDLPDDPEPTGLAWIGPRLEVGAAYTVASAPQTEAAGPDAFQGLGARAGLGVDVGIRSGFGALIGVGYHGLSDIRGIEDTPDAMHLGFLQIGPTFRARDAWLQASGLFGGGNAAVTGVNPAFSSACDAGSADADCAAIVGLDDEQRDAWPWEAAVRVAGLQASATWAFLDLTSLQGGLSLAGGLHFDAAPDAPTSPDRRYSWGQVAWTFGPPNP